jgi:hypothetical protein
MFEDFSWVDDMCWVDDLANDLGHDYLDPEDEDNYEPCEIFTT